MAGTLFGLSLSQRVDLNSKPSVGWLLYLYQANTSTPVNSYVDQGLSSLNPWPLVADGYGTMAQFWLADGSYRARATSADGSQIYFDQQNILALTPYVPTGGGGGGPPVIDPTSTFQTGDVIWADTQGTRTGWVRDNGRTIGSALSSGTERANNDTQNLFTFLWNGFPDTICPVGGGRGGSAASDWSANKAITLPDHRGTGVMGLDDMGNAAAGRLAAAPLIVGGVTQPGSLIGEGSHVLSSGEMPAHTHTATSTVTDPGHTHNTNASAINLSYTAGGTGPSPQSGTTATSSATTGVTVATSNASTGGGGAHNIIQRTALGTFYRKL
jgi:hypothetical protein